MREIGPFKPPYILADDLNALLAEVVRQRKLDVEGGDLDQTAGGPKLRVPIHTSPIPVKITEVGDPTTEDTVPHSWKQQRPKQDGTWEDDPNGLEGMADGTKAGPAFRSDGGAAAVDEIVWITKSYVGVVDGVVRQEWEFPATAPASGTIKLRITGRPRCVDGHKWYPAVPRQLRDLAFEDGSPEKWLLQKDDAPLGTGGNFTCDADRDVAGATKTIGGDTRPVYWTDKRLWVLEAKCVSGQLVNYYEDTYGGCDEPGGLWANGLFAAGLWADGLFS